MVNCSVAQRICTADTDFVRVCVQAAKSFAVSEVQTTTVIVASIKSSFMFRHRV